MLHIPKFQIFSTESNTETVVYCSLQPFTEKRLFMSIFFNKVAGLQPKKGLHQRCFQPVCLIFQNMFAWGLLLLNTIYFLCCIDLISKMLWLSLNIFRETTESLANSCFWKPQTTSQFIADKTSDTSKMSLQIRSSRPTVQSFLKIMVCKTSQVSQESISDVVTFS